jgi:hypothetical protein
MNIKVTVNNVLRSADTYNILPASGYCLRELPAGGKTVDGTAT